MTLAELLPSGIGVGAAAAIAVAGLIAGAARGFSGFGGALVFMPLASSFAPPRLVAPALLLFDFIAASPLIRAAWKQADRRAVAMMALGCAVGTPLGALALARLDPITTRWLISIFVLGLLVLLISGWRYTGGDRPSVAVGTGCLAGLCNGLAQTGGPPVVAYWMGRKVSARLTRANLILYFAASSTLSIISYLASGLITSDVFKLSIVIGPAYAAGILLGAAMFGHASERTFRLTCYTLIGAAAVVGLPVLDGVLR